MRRIKTHVHTREVENLTL